MRHFSTADNGSYYVAPTDLNGKPYTPGRSYSWITAEYRAICAQQMDCAPAEVEYRLDARDAMDAKIAERREYEHPVRMASNDRERF